MERKAVHLFLRKAIQFGVVIILLYPFVIWVMASYSPGFMRKNVKDNRGGYGFMFSRLAEADTTTWADVLVVGSSHAYRSYDPRHFKQHGLRLLNLGSSNQTPMQTEYLLRKYMAKIKPKLVIYDIFGAALTADGVESQIDLLTNSNLDQSLLTTSLSLRNIRVFNALILNGIHQVFTPTYQENPIKADDRYIPGGFVEKNMATFDGKDCPSENRGLNTCQLHHFNQILAYLDSQHQPYMLLQAPISQCLRSKVQARYDYDVLTSVKKFDTLSLTDTLHFYDAEHLNTKGVDLYNAALMEYLQQEQPKLFLGR